MFEHLKLEEDKQKESEQANNECQSAFISKRQNNNKTKQVNVKECFKCGQKGHIKKYCRNKPSESYIEYCKKNYPCNKCNEKGHFAKNCTKNVVSQKNHTNLRQKVN